MFSTVDFLQTVCVQAESVSEGRTVALHGGRLCICHAIYDKPSNFQDWIAMDVLDCCVARLQEIKCLPADHINHSRPQTSSIFPSIPPLYTEKPYIYSMISSLTKKSFLFDADVRNHMKSELMLLCILIGFIEC